MTCEDLSAIQFVSPSEGWIVGFNGTILHTINHGTTWELQQSELSDNLISLSFVSPTEGWILTSGHGLLHTTNGGIQWSLLNSNVGGFAIQFTSTQSGWLTSFFGAIYHTTDGGAHWTLQNSGTSENLVHLQFALQIFHPGHKMLLRMCMRVVCP
ncbi:MAG: YCF48-related protein [Saprospiraceae bacterium]